MTKFSMWIFEELALLEEIPRSLVVWPRASSFSIYVISPHESNSIL